MKRFIDYLTDSKKTYDFKVKIANDEGDRTKVKIESSLVQFDPESCKQSIRTPIQESHLDFPTHKNISVTVYDVCLRYPATTEQVRAKVAECLGLSHACVIVRTLSEDAETDLNHQHDSVSKDPILGKPYDVESHQHCVGEEQKMALLKELNRTKHTGEKYSSVNNQLLASSTPFEKITDQDEKIQQTSPVGSKPTKVPKAKTFSGL